MNQLPAGRELDALVAKALGYVRVPVATAKRNPLGVEGFVFTVAKGVPSFDDGVYIRHVNSGDFARFAPSVDIAAAFQIVDKLLDGTRAFVLKYGTRVFTLGCDTGAFTLGHWRLEADQWQAMFKGKLNEETMQFEQIIYAYAETIPLAICHAALKVVAEEAAGE